RRRLRRRGLPAARDRAAVRPDVDVPRAGMIAVRGAIPLPGPEHPALGLHQVLDERGVAEPDRVPSLPPDEWLRISQGMLRIRVMDERLIAMQRQGRIGFYGEARGQEAAVI